MTAPAGDPLETAQQTRADLPSSVPWRAVITFVALAYGLAWLIALPMWIFPGVSTAAFMMLAPALATLVVVFAMRVPARERLRSLGVWPLRPAKRVVGAMVAALFGPMLVVLLTIAVSAALGWLQLDLVHFSGFAEMNAAALPPGTDAVSPQLLIAMQLALVPIVAILPNSIFALGEEIGWRGWLLPALRPLGTWPALALSGAIWGLWHMPVTLLGHNFGLTDWRGVALMTTGGVAWGVLLGWMRLRTGSVWPAVIAHGALNASGGAVLLVFAAGTDPSLTLVNPLGVAGWIVLGAVIIALAVTGQFRTQPTLAARPERSAHAPR